MKPDTYNTLLALCLLVSLAACAGASKTENEKSDNLPDIRTSPLGIDQPDPERLAQSAIDAYGVGDVWGFLSHFGFMDAQTGAYFTPVNDKDDPFHGTKMNELRPLARSLFPLMNSKSSSIVFGRPKTVRNRPLTVDVPFTVTYDFSQLTAAEQDATLLEVNTSLHSQGQPTITFEQYVEKVMALPAESGHRFIYREKRWYIDGAQWRPYRIKQ